MVSATNLGVECANMEPGYHIINAAWNSAASLVPKTTFGFFVLLPVCNVELLLWDSGPMY